MIVKQKVRQVVYIRQQEFDLIQSPVSRFHKRFDTTTQADNVMLPACPTHIDRF